MLKRKEYEDRYGVEVVDDPTAPGGTRTVERPPDEAETKQEAARRQKREEKRAMRRLREKEKRIKRKRRAGKAFREEAAREASASADHDSDGQEDRAGAEKEFAAAEEVAFGDVAMAPPALRGTGPRGAPAAPKGEAAVARRPGASDSLLLRKKLQPVAGRKGDSLAKRHRLDGERRKAVEEYRRMKKEARLGKVKL